jgi:hypothetical protein
MSTRIVVCPYCATNVEISPCTDYAPKTHVCTACAQKFIVEKTASGVHVMKEQDAPCMSNPDCRDVEMSGTCEE